MGSMNQMAWLSQENTTAGQRYARHQVPGRAQSVRANTVTTSVQLTSSCSPPALQYIENQGVKPGILFRDTVQGLLSAVAQLYGAVNGGRATTYFNGHDHSMSLGNPAQVMIW